MVQRVTENTVREAPITGARLQAHDYGGEAYGRALEGFGRQLSQTVDQVDEVVYKFDLAEAKKADAEDAIELAKIRATALSAVGTQAPDAAEQARIAADQLKKTRLTNLKGRRGELYATSFDQRMAAFEGQLTEHSIKQADIAERGAAAARSETSVQLAVDGYSDPKIWRDNIITAESEFRKANAGMAEDTLKLKWAQEKSKANVQVVQSIMAIDPENPGAAEKWLDEHSAEILPEHEPALRKSLQPLLDNELAYSDYARAQAAGAGDPNATLPEGEDQPDMPTSAVPVEGPKDLPGHLVGKKGRITDTATAHRARGSNNALDIAAPLGTTIRPPMSGKVSKSWLDTEHGGGWSLLIQHPNGMVTGYAHMKSRPFFEPGQEVDSTTVVGLVGATGKATGPHLHFTVRDAKGTKVDPQTVDWAAVAGSGGPKMVDPEKVSWKEGELVRATADKNSLNVRLDNIYRLATKENWSQPRYDRTVGIAKEQAALSDQLYRQQYDDFKEGVWGKIAQLDGGDGLTSITQLGGDFGRLEGSDQLTVQNLIQANKKRLEGEGAIKANGDEYSTWSLAATSGVPADRQEFLKQDFRANPNMTAAERLRLSQLQNRMRTDEDGTLAANIDRIRGTINRYAPEAGFSVTAADKGDKKGMEDRRRRALLIDKTTALANKRQNELGRPLNDQELDAIVRSQVVTVQRGEERLPLYIARTTGKTTDKPDAVDPDRIWETMPVDVKNQIIQSLQRAGVRPTPRLVIETYLESSK